MDFIQGEKFKSLADNISIFYRHTHDVNNFFKNLKINQQFILISHNSDGNITDLPKQYDADVRLMPNNLVKWYGQNVNYIHEKIESLPVGLENNEWFPSTQKKEKIIEINKYSKNIKNLLYINHNVNNNRKERIEPYDIFKNKNYCTMDYGKNGIMFDEYIDNAYNHEFVLAPEGNGIDTHRLWECLYLNTIPIVRTNINNLFYTDLPICFINEWQDLDEDFLDKQYEKIINYGHWNYDKLKIDYWRKLIDYYRK